MKVYNIKSKNDAIEILKERSDNQWEGRMAIIEETGLMIRWFQGACTWTLNGEQTNFDEIVNVMYKNRKKINAITI